MSTERRTTEAEGLYEIRFEEASREVDGGRGTDDGSRSAMAAKLRSVPWCDDETDDEARGSTMPRLRSVPGSDGRTRMMEEAGALWHPRLRSVPWCDDGAGPMEAGRY